MFDAGDGADAGEHVLQSGTAFVGIAAIVIVVVDFDGGGRSGFEAEIDIQHAQEAAHEQTGADEEHAGERDFRDDKCGAQALVTAAVAGTVAGGVLE